MRSSWIATSVVLAGLIPFIAHAQVVKPSKPEKQSAPTTMNKTANSAKIKKEARKAMMETARAAHKAANEAARTQYTDALKAAKAIKSKDQMKAAKAAFDAAKKAAQTKLKADLEAAKTAPVTPAPVTQ